MSKYQAPYPIVPEFNPFAPAQCQNPYPVYQELRQQTPIFFSPVLDMWVVTRYEDIQAITRDTARFSSAQTIDPLSSLPPEALEILMQGYPDVPNLVNNDPPDHTRVRRLCNKAFTPKRIATLEPSVRELVNMLIDDFVNDGQADLMRQFAHPLPRMVIADMVGVPRSDIDKFGEWADAWSEVLFVQDLPAAKQVEGAKAFVALQKYNAAMMAKRRETPEDDLLSDLIHAQSPDGSSLSEFDIIATLNAFLVAGHKTTTDFIGNLLVMLLSHPDHLEALRANPELASKLQEESLRHEAPVPGMMRNATESVTINGVTIPEGSRVYLIYGSGNHDEALFDEPMHFNPDRPNLHQHLAFGHGIHYCIGAPLARLEGKVALQVLTERLPNLRWQAGHAAHYAPNLVFRGPVSLPLAWDVD